MGIKSQIKDCYTLCFIFNETLDQILLIRKNRPVWQAGLLNAIGGKLLPKEDYRDCAAREVYEESGLKIERDSFNNFAEITGNDVIVVCYYTVLDSEIFNSHKSLTDEIIQPYSILYTANLESDLIPNVYPLISLALTDIKCKKRKLLYPYTILNYNANNKLNKEL